MDFEYDNNPSQQPQERPPEPRYDYGYGKPPKKRSAWRVFLGILMAMSVVANIVLFLMLIGVVALFAAGQRGILTEEVVREGPVGNKIAMITVEGIIHGQLADDVYTQLKAARSDERVKALIVRVNSPGGTISASDQIYKQITKFRQEEHLPVVAFMQGVAASGGYYASVACDKIIAEPTAITGSIGVISWWLVVQELLEDKLGVMPVTIKSGQKKDWPSSFREPAPEEVQYMQDKLVTPAYERFLEVVTEGRKASLSSEEVRELADGGIFVAKEALEEKLIDDIGYLDEAIEAVKSMAGIGGARVVQYRRPFSFSDFLGARRTNLSSLLKLDRTTLYDLATPQVLYLWSAY